MRCPTLAELPSPPPGKTGWPWTIESPQLPDTMPDGSLWPRISIVTPSYNQGQFVEETIRSVLLQGYPDIEYIVMDGGSSDESVGIIQRYSTWMAHWQSGSDNGQVAALNSGFQKCSGDLLNWLNSDDLLHKNALINVARCFELVPNVDVISACRTHCNKQSEDVWTDKSSISYWPLYRFGTADFPQDATFISKKTLIENMPLDERFNFIFDTALYTKIMRKNPVIVFIDASISSIRMYPEMKTLRSDEKKEGEQKILQNEYIPTSIFSKIIFRLFSTRYHALALAVVRLLFTDYRMVFILKFDPMTSQWLIRSAR
ncbi:MAG: glycosyltransferase [Hyphomicrobiales bacterium]|nr:glycosyltransferase [Hyphomicrobiales bacterium]